MVLKAGLSKGAWVVHAYHGVGQIKGVDKRTLEGETKKYYRIETAESAYWLPIEQADDVEHIRPLASKSTFSRALSTIRKKPEELNEDHKKRAREISDRLGEGTVVSLARLIRDLHGKKYTDRLNLNEENTFERVKKQFVLEWAVAAELKAQDAVSKLEQALEISVEKLPQPQ